MFIMRTFFKLKSVNFPRIYDRKLQLIIELFTCLHQEFKVICLYDHQSKYQNQLYINSVFAYFRFRPLTFVEESKQIRYN